MENQAVVPFQDLERMAVAVAKSGLFGCKSPEQAITLMLIAQAENIPVMQAVLDYNIIDNKPALKADAMLRRFQQAGGVIKWVEMTDEKVSAYFSHPSCPDPLLVDWDMARAAKAELSTRQYKSGGTNMWQKYPRQMLRARVISEGIRAVYPGGCSGFYTPEEVQDFERPEIAQNRPLETRSSEVMPTHAEAEIVENPPQKPSQDKEETKGLSQKSIQKFEIALKILGKEDYSKILEESGLKNAHDIKEDYVAKEVLRKMRIAAESKGGKK
jgi:hypothetical protein